MFLGISTYNRGKSLKLGTILNRGVAVLCASALIMGACSSDAPAAKTTSAPADVTTKAPEVTTPAPAPDATDPAPEATDPPAVVTDPPVTDPPAPALLEGLVDNGPCDTALPTVDLAITTTFDAGVLQLKQQVDASEAAVKAFNSRGGIGGRCMSITSCDDKADPNIAADCARQTIESSAVATINDTTSAGDAAVSTLYVEANMARVGQSPGSPDLNAPVSYNLGGGGVGTTMMMLPPLFKAGKTKIAAIHVDLPAFAAFLPILKIIIEANGAELVATIPVPAGTTNFDQFILAAEDAGADGVFLPLGAELAVPVIKAAGELGTEILFATSLGSLSQADVAGLGEIAKQVVFNAETPPPTDADTNPAVAQLQADFTEFGGDTLTPEKLKSSGQRSWLAVYAFVTIMSATDTENITRESVIAAMNAATDVPMLGLTPPWTPNKASPGAFTRISNGAYYTAGWDGERFTTDAEQSSLLDVLKASGLGG
jgi:branched-chain amino acid transport system substrate-binding protein